mgnify:FL=1|jgi:hypothetical protein
MAKAFIGTWISKEARIKLKVACAKHSVHQGDIIELLILKWLDEEHVKNV